jgi:hypothetical protein
MGRRNVFIAVVLVLGSVAMPAPGFAQSAIAGVVKDATSGVLPGVTVEASSPALIEKTRTVVSDDAGQYKIIDLRPGTYTVTFTLSGFSAVKREGVELPPNFTVSVNAEMRVGAVEETITVAGSAPVVDVQSAVKAQVLNSELLNALPTARNFQTAGLALPGLKAGGFDVGGNTQQQQGVVVAAGGVGTDQIMMVDGMNVMSTTGGAGTVVYHNVGGYQEMVYQSFGSSAEMQSGGVIMNMIPKTGGNQVRFDGVGLFANTSMEGDNLDASLLDKGFKFPGKLEKTWDVNGSLGFPMVKDRLWWFTSVRNWTYNTFVANQFYPNGAQAIDDNINKAYTNRMTWQVSSKNKFTALYDKLPRTRFHSGIETGTLGPEAATNVNYDLGYIAQAKYTGTFSSRLLVEAGFSSSYYRAQSHFESPDQYPSAGNPLGAISHLNTTTGFTTIAPANLSHPLQYNKPNYMAAASYVTGSHAIKAGLQYAYGRHRTFTSGNASLQQLYHTVGTTTGVPYAVNVYNTPTFAETDMKHDIDLFVQDSWTLRRLTLNPGLRYEDLEEGLPAQSAPAGPFVAPRQFPAVGCIPCWKDLMGRLGAAYDVFGDGKTAIKGSVGKFMGTEMNVVADAYNAMNVATDQRTWTDLNHDDIAQANEIGPSTNQNFGVQTRFPSPGLKRPYQMLYSVGVQHQLGNGVSASVTYYHREYRRILATENTLVPNTADGFAAEYTTVTIPDPRGNGQTLTVYNLKPQYLGLVHEVDYNSPTNSRRYDGFDVTFNARLPGQITLVGGTTTGKFHRVTCDVESPNSLPNCDAPVPFTTGLKLSGTVPLKYGLRLSMIFQSQPGQTFSRDSLTDGDIIQNYIITRAVVPSLTVASVTQRLNASGVDFMPRVNQLDVSLSKRVRVGRTEIVPQLDVFNALNVNPITSINQNYGPSYGFPLTVLPARLFRVGAQVRF